MDENSLTNDTPTGDIDGIDVDSLIESVEGSSNQDRAMSAPEPAAPAPQTVAELEFTYGDKAIKAPFTDPRVKQWAAQGYDYSQRMAKFNETQAQKEAEWKEREAKYSPYKQIDEYAQQNPDWWKHVESTWQSRAQAAAGAAADAQSKGFDLPPEVKAEIESLKKFKSDFEAEKAAQREQAEDGKLQGEIQSIRKDYANLDWNTPDSNGQTLEKRVLKHAMENGISNFRAAFRDYNHEKLLELHEHKGRENAIKDVQKRTKLGLLGESSAPRKGLAQAENVKNKSYGDLEREALEELGIA